MASSLLSVLGRWHAVGEGDGERVECGLPSGDPACVYPAIRTLWMNAWTEFVPFLDYDLEIRRVLCSTNAIESLNARFRRAVRARGHFPTEQAALKTLYLVVRSLDPKAAGQTLAHPPERGIGDR